MDTCDLVDKDAGGDDASVLREELLQLFLGHGLGQAAHIQVGVTDRSRAGSRIRDLRNEKIKNKKLAGEPMNKHFHHFEGGRGG